MLGSRLFGKQAPALLCVVVMANSGPQGHISKGAQLEKHRALVSTQTEDQWLACPFALLLKHSGMQLLLEETVHEKLIASVFK